MLRFFSPFCTTFEHPETSDCLLSSFCLPISKYCPNLPAIVYTPSQSTRVHLRDRPLQLVAPTPGVTSLHPHFRPRWGPLSWSPAFCSWLMPRLLEHRRCRLPRKPPPTLEVRSSPNAELTSSWGDTPGLETMVSRMRDFAPEPLGRSPDPPPRTSSFLFGSFPGLPPDSRCLETLPQDVQTWGFAHVTVLALESLPLWTHASFHLGTVSHVLSSITDKICPGGMSSGAPTMCQVVGLGDCVLKLPC